MATEVELRIITVDDTVEPRISRAKNELGSIPGPPTDLPYSSSTPTLTKARSIMLMVTLSGISFLKTFNSGMLTVALPTIATDLGLPTALLLWPASVYALTQGCTLLLLGAIADVVDNRPLFLAGAALFTVFTLACSLARTWIELIAIRALQGVAVAFCMPTAVSTITESFPSGKGRNVAFAVFGGGSPIGFAAGLVLGGVFVEATGWRTCYYFACGVNAVISVAACCAIPASKTREGSVWHRLVNDLDWVGVAAVSASLGMSSYVFA
jgi:MFS family permease